MSGDSARGPRLWPERSDKAYDASTRDALTVSVPAGPNGALSLPDAHAREDSPAVVRGWPFGVSPRKVCARARATVEAGVPLLPCREAEKRINADADLNPEAIGSANGRGCHRLAYRNAPERSSVHHSCSADRSSSRSRQQDGHNCRSTNPQSKL